MGRLAVIGGTGVRDSAFGADAEPVTVDGVPLLDAGNLVILQRHGLGAYVRPHEIDHVANLRALDAAGCDRVLALSSTGSLRVDWPVGTVVCPDDFYAPQVNVTAHRDARSHTVPGFDPSWRARVLAAWDEHAATPIVDGGVYTQTRGPRFETPAEVRALTRLGDLVGMTIAAECILSRELGLAYAAVCVVDNLANGLGAAPLTVAEFQAAVDANRVRLLADLDAVLPVLAGG
ncbi:MAG TPA: MTAP family purine nucleoside phosphorylase [Acidimicrobiia bacterium]